LRNSCFASHSSWIIWYSHLQWAHEILFLHILGHTRNVFLCGGLLLFQN
jgi:hypothetical protein